MLEFLAIGGLLAWAMVQYDSNTVLSALRLSDNSGAKAQMTQMINNGFQYRDNMFSTMADWIGHPDMKNNYFALNRKDKAVRDLGIYGVERDTVQLYEGVSEPMQIYRRSNLVL